MSAAGKAYAVFGVVAIFTAAWLHALVWMLAQSAWLIVGIIWIVEPLGVRASDPTPEAEK